MNDAVFAIILTSAAALGRRLAVAIQSKLAALRYLARIDLSFNRDSALEVSRMKRKVLIAARNGLGLRRLPCADHL